VIEYCAYLLVKPLERPYAFSTFHDRLRCAQDFRVTLLIGTAHLSTMAISAPPSLVPVHANMYSASKTFLELRQPAVDTSDDTHCESSTDSGIQIEEEEVTIQPQSSEDANTETRAEDTELTHSMVVSS
jgi:hypothetical protein